MPHIHTEPGQHDQTVSALIIRLDTPQPQLLLHLHKKYGKWMQPGGHIELSESPWQAVLHEITEETGYVLDQLQLLQPSERLQSINGAVVHPVALVENTHKAGGDDHYHSDRAYLFATTTLPQNTPDEGESTDFKWVTAEELQKIPVSELTYQIREIGLYALSTGRSWERVPLSDFQS